MKREVIIEKLIQKQIIDSENNLNDDVEKLIFLLENNYPTEKMAVEILESDLMSKYDLNILNECIDLKP